MKSTYYSAGYLGKHDRYDVPRVFAFVCAVACANCGHFLSVKWETDSDSASVPAEARKKISVCPVCGKKTPLKNDLSAVTKATSLNAAVQELEMQIDRNTELAFRKSVDTLISKMPPLSEQPAENKLAQRVVSEEATLKQYILNLLSAESAVYFLTERIVGLRKAQRKTSQQAATEIAKMGQDRIANEKKLAAAAEKKRKEDEKSAKNEISALKKKVTACKKEIAGIKQELSEKDWSTEVERQNIPHPRRKSNIVIAKPVMPVQPVLKRLGLFNRQKIEEENAMMMTQYRAKLAAYNQACADMEEAIKENQRREQQYREEMAAYNAQMNIEELRIQQEAQILKEKAKPEAEAKIRKIKEQIEQLTAQIAQKEAQAAALTEVEPTAPALTTQTKNMAEVFLDRELSEAEKQLKHAVKARQQLYSYGIIHSKYRNQVALSTIYEYLDTGRCNGLTGANGAYNLYEAECRSNLIISQLTQVIETLEEIKQTQYMIYSELKQINANLDRLNQKMDRAVSELISLRDEVGNMNNTLMEIAGNTELLLDNSHKVTQNTETIVKNTSAIMSDTQSIAQSANQIQKNTAITAYYSVVNAHYAKINAQLTNAVGFMLALK